MVSVLNISKGKFRSKTGYTVIELLAIMTILVIVASIASPEVTRMYARVSINSTALSLKESILSARAESYLRQSRVALCAGTPEQQCQSNDWSQGWTTFYSNMDAIPATFEPIAFYEISGLSISFQNDSLFNEGIIVFDGLGIMNHDNILNGEIIFCHSAVEEYAQLDILLIGQAIEQKTGNKPRICA